MALGIEEKKRALNGLTHENMPIPDGGVTKYYMGYNSGTLEFYSWWISKPHNCR